MRRHVLWSAGVFLVALAYAGCSDSGDGSASGGYGGAQSGASGVGAEGGAFGIGGSGPIGGASGASGIAGVAGIAGVSGASGSSGASGTSAGGAFGFGGSGPRDGALPDVHFDYDAAPEDAGGVGDGCANVTARAEASPIDMYIILDDSGSMHDPILFQGGDCNISASPPNNSKWCLAIHALDGFFRAPSSNQMGVALNYFNTGGNQCNSRIPPAVPLQNLPTHQAALVTSLNNTAPNGGTPTLPAAQGIVDFTRPNQRPGRRMIGIIITDGDPSGCSSSPQNVNQALAAHYTAAGIPTFIVGMEGASLGNLEVMANGAGALPHTNYCGINGPNPCHYYSVGNGDPQAFITAMDAIRRSAIGCVFNMPRSDAGVINPSRVRVTYSAGGQPPPQEITRFNNVGACPAGSPGWYYDNNTAPNTINLCPGTCNAVKGDAAARIDVIVACQGS